jgi:hypothetical protein
MSAVRIGITPMTPHQLWKYTPAAMTAAPTTNRTTLSDFPMFRFMSLTPCLINSFNNDEIKRQRVHKSVTKSHWAALGPGDVP